MNAIVGNKIKVLRKQKGLSQEEVADHLHISQSTYARIENGERGSWANYIVPISNLFGVQPEELLKQDNIHIETIETNGAVYNMGTVNQLSEKLITQYEERLKEKDKLIALLEKTIQDLKSSFTDK